MPSRRVGHAHAIGGHAVADVLGRVRSPSGDGGGIVGFLDDRRDEAVAAAVHRRDDALLLAVVAYRSPRLLEPAGDRRLADEPIAPHDVEQLGFGYEPVAMGDQVDQHVEHLGFDVDDLAAASSWN